MSVHAKKSGGEVMMGWNHPCDTVEDTSQTKHVCISELKLLRVQIISMVQIKSICKVHILKHHRTKHVWLCIGEIKHLRVQIISMVQIKSICKMQDYQVMYVLPPDIAIPNVNINYKDYIPPWQLAAEEGGPATCCPSSTASWKRSLDTS